MYINRNHLRQLIYNTLLFTPGKGNMKRSISEGLVSLKVADGVLSLLSTDGYVAVHAGERNLGDRLWVYGYELKDAERYLNSIDEDDVQLSVAGEEIYIGKQPVTLRTPASTDGKWWDHVEDYIFNHVEVNPDDFFELKDFFWTFQTALVDPRRWSKFSLLEPKDFYPLDMKLRHTSLGQAAFFWKYGPDTFGVYAQLMRDVVAENFENPEDALWRV